MKRKITYDFVTFTTIKSWCIFDILIPIFNMKCIFFFLKINYFIHLKI